MHCVLGSKQVCHFDAASVSQSRGSVKSLSKAIVLIAFKFVENSKCIFIWSLNLKKRGLNLENLDKCFSWKWRWNSGVTPFVRRAADVVTWSRQTNQSALSVCAEVREAGVLRMSIAWVTRKVIFDKIMNMNTDKRTSFTNLHILKLKPVYLG